jgi:hypothetical protein
VSATDATQFCLVPSRSLALLIVVAHGAAGAAVTAVAPQAVAGWILAVLLVALGMATAWDRALLRGGRAVRAFACLGPELIELKFADGGRARARVAVRRWVGPGLVVLALSTPGRRSLLVTAAMLERDAFRRLRMWALWGAIPGVASMPREPIS